MGVTAITPRVGPGTATCRLHPLRVNRNGNAFPALWEPPQSAPGPLEGERPLPPTPSPAVPHSPSPWTTPTGRDDPPSGDGGHSKDAETPAWDGDMPPTPTPCQSKRQRLSSIVGPPQSGPGPLEGERPLPPTPSPAVPHSPSPWTTPTGRDDPPSGDEGHSKDAETRARDGDMPPTPTPCQSGMATFIQHCGTTTVRFECLMYDSAYKTTATRNAQIGDFCTQSHDARRDNTLML